MLLAIKFHFALNEGHCYELRLPDMTLESVIAVPQSSRKKWSGQELSLERLEYACSDKQTL